ncbi:hypothetical protein C8R46DRAFT_330318 [Mycena filopes]|nr:hypothetical protein C8R46DRAFT_330318 [Mycena filopes]
MALVTSLFWEESCRYSLLFAHTTHGRRVDSGARAKMLAALFFYFLHASQALPIAESPGTPPTDSSADSTRTVPGIVWSCLTTIFACTWIAVHPNVPNPHERESTWANLRRRLWIFVVALIAPEYIIAWAVGQFWHARRSLAGLRRFGPCKDWTLTQGFFLTMGGFELVDEQGKRLGVLDKPSLATLLLDHRVVLPPIPSSEINDKSKGDTVGKLLVLVQTTWFMAQAVSRAVQKLPMTELELTTVAFASLNIITYILWWKKPLDVQRPMVLTLIGNHSSPSQRPAPPVAPVDVPPEGTLSTHVAVKDAGDAGCDTSVANCDSADRSVPNSSAVSTRLASGPTTAGDEGSPTITFNTPEPAIVTDIFLVRRLSRVFRPAWIIVTEVISAIVGADEIEETSTKVDPVGVLSSHKRVVGIIPAKLPTFYRGPSSSFRPLQIAAETSIGALFGAIHCAAWTFRFPTQGERTLWRVISLYITVTPLLLAMLHSLELLEIEWLTASFLWRCSWPWYARESHRGALQLCRQRRFLRLQSIASSSPAQWAAGLSVWVLSRVGGLLVILFILARITTFVCAFVLLRDLPPGTLKEVQWLSFIPHI